MDYPTRLRHLHVWGDSLSRSCFSPVLLLLFFFRLKPNREELKRSDRRVLGVAREEETQPPLETALPEDCRQERTRRGID